MNATRLQEHNKGAIWQQHTAHMSLVERVDELEGQLAIANKQLAAMGLMLKTVCFIGVRSGSTRRSNLIAFED